MDYKKQYKNLIDSRKLLNRVKSKEFYFENHHILPKCLEGSNDKDNLILLTAKEHFIAHLLLSEMFEGKEKQKMSFALWRLCSQTFKGRRYKITSSLYEKIKNEHSKIVSKRLKGRLQSEEWKEKNRQAQLNSTWERKGNKTERTIEQKNKTSLQFKNKKQSAEQIAKRMIVHKGKKMSEETKRKISEANKGKIPWNFKLDLKFM